MEGEEEEEGWKMTVMMMTCFDADVPRTRSGKT